MNDENTEKKEEKYLWSWQCHICGWDALDVTDSENFYYIEDKKAKEIIDSWIKVDPNDMWKGMKPNLQVLGLIATVKRVIIYPLIKNFHTVQDFYTGTYGKSWDEIHKCPNCNIEFEYENSTI